MKEISRAFRLHEDYDWENAEDNPNNDLTNGGMYMGEFNDVGEAHGEGFVTFQDSRYYKGTWKNGAVHGFGVLGSLDGRRLEGELQNGQWIGKCTSYQRKGQ